MTFNDTYTKLLQSADFGEIKPRKDQLREMYIAGLQKAIELCNTKSELRDAIHRIEYEIEQEKNHG